VVLAAVLLAGGIAVDVLPGASEPAGAAGAGKPNIVFILTDDQTLSEMAAMPQTTALIGGQGATFERFYISYPLCCPSRATMLTGQYMHNTGVRGNNPPFGGWDRFSGLGDEAKDLPVWLQAAGYKTVGIGKYLNGYGAGVPTVPPGWDEWYGKLSQYDNGALGNRIYFNYSLLEQGPDGPPAKLVNYGQSEADYQTDVLGDKAVDAIHRLAGPGNADPFFLNLWVSAPHAPYLPAARYAGAFDGLPIRHDAAFNEASMKDKPKFMRKLHRLSKKKIRTIDQRSRDRYAQLLSVDDTVAHVVQALDQEGVLDNTYIVFTSDNGYFAGEHRLAQGKYLPYEPSSHVPMLIRGPGITPGTRTNELVSNADIAPTFSEIADATPQVAEDGRSMLPFARNPALRTTRPILLEGDTGANLTGGEAIEAGAHSGKLKHQAGVGNLEQEPIARIAAPVRAPAYRAIRTDRYLYVAYANGGTELYDMQNDPLQLRSLQHDPRYRLVKQILLARLKALETCAGPACDAADGPDPAPLAAAPHAGNKKKSGHKKKGRR
jgi:arylsulfatase A-like enzyme